MLRDEYIANLEAIERAFPGCRLLTKKQMREYLGVGDLRVLKQFGIETRLTKESFAVRLVQGKE